MRSISIVDFRKSLSRNLDEVVAGKTPLAVKRTRGKPNVVILSGSDFRGWQETVHLLSSPANADRLLCAAERADESRSPPR